MLIVAIPCHKTDHLRDLLSALESGSQKPDAVVVAFDRVEPVVSATGFPFDVLIINVQETSPANFRAGFIRNRLYKFIKENYSTSKPSIVFLDCDVIPSHALISEHARALTDSEPTLSLGRRLHDEDDTAAYDCRDVTKNRLGVRMFSDRTTTMHTPVCFEKASHCQSHNVD